MIRLFVVVAMVSGSSCVLGHFTQRGERTSLVQLDKRVSDINRSVKVEDDVSAHIGFERRTCVDWKSTYTKKFYEKRNYPAHVVTAFSMLIGFSGFFTGIFSQNDGFVWPESRPAITPISFATAGIFGLVTVLAGLVPMGAGAINPRNVLLRTENTTEFNRVETDCSTEELTLTGKVPYRAWLYEDPVKGFTDSSGVLKVREAAVAALQGEKFTPSRLRFLEENPEMYVKFELGGTARQLGKVDLYELRIYANSLKDSCSEACIDASEAKVCVRRHRICMEEAGRDICDEMRNTCLEKESSNKRGFEACFDACVKKKLPDLFKRQ